MKTFLLILEFFVRGVQLVTATAFLFTIVRWLLDDEYVIKSPSVVLLVFIASFAMIWDFILFVDRRFKP